MIASLASRASFPSASKAFISALPWRALAPVRCLAVAPKPPRHRSAAKRSPARPAVRASTDADRSVDEEASGRLPDWVLEDKPVWLQALLQFLRQPDLLLVRVGVGPSERCPRSTRPGSLPELQEVQLPSHAGLRDWGQREQAEAVVAGRRVRPVAVLAQDPDLAADAVEVLKSLGFTRVANLRTQAFLEQIRRLPHEA
eukprot:TRINITY_DN99525_c0_g1_i1.p2 TRINITY_DN99525_c0_g1~~TRINITY_DN99525_c0_g1_i1.p2  ORF type:complete len:199 (+),score=28.47 TRINITY_DN99525_c0_g1_i1:45-641(+)